MPDVTFLVLVTATAFHGILAGASLDQSIKQLPARRRIGAGAYAAYARAADLANGVAWYAVIGLGAALLTILAGALALSQGVSLSRALPVYLAAGLAVLHTLVTTQAAPTMFSLRRTGDDEAALSAILNRFERWQTLRAILQAAAFAALLWGMAVAGRGG